MSRRYSGWRMPTRLQNDAQAGCFDSATVIPMLSWGELSGHDV